MTRRDDENESPTGEDDVKYEANAKALMDAVDAILGGGRLDEGTVGALLEVLGEQGSGEGLDVRVVLCVVEHPVVAGSLRAGEVPAALEARLTEALSELAPLFGRWMAGALAERAERLRQRYDAELHKYELVRKRLERESVEGVAQILARYLDTAPAAMFARRMEVAFGEAYGRAEVIRSEEDQALLCNEELLALLAFGEGFGEAEAERLDELLAGLVERLDGAVERVVRRTLEGGKSEAKLVAGALAVRQGLSERASALLAMVIHGDPYAHQAAVFAARLAPLLTLHVLGQFLVDVLKSTGVEDDQERHTEGAIVASRLVLPWIGSPIPEAGYAGKPSAHRIAETVRRAWGYFDQG
ncbi:hypothetical protein EA187_07325 [Lujinxingia sediminis]|uniref:Uncharacterized protein n=1 Tax=Lujinxingia sediminis TaxID=2480984 RepID=A0ABY0CV47_9DELT|nr:hypothetical protein [Lujinxingia sediminis]RVU46938.1 hypothetical protein EA187_07325 [Lujinxingia sediminis]